MSAFAFDISDEPVFEEPSEDTPIESFFEPDEPAQPAPETYDTVDTAFAKPAPRSNKARAYQKKVHAGFFKPAFLMAAQHPATVADAAAIIMHGPKLETKLGDLAASNDTVAKMIDFLDEGTSNPVGAALVAAVPLVFQLIRNHEPVLAPAARGFRVPFMKAKDGTPRRVTLKWKIGIKLGRIRNMTNEPAQLEAFVFDNPDIKALMLKQDVTVARSNGRRRGTRRDESQ